MKKEYNIINEEKENKSLDYKRNKVKYSLMYYNKYRLSQENLMMFVMDV